MVIKTPGSGLDLDPDPYWIRIWIGIQTKMPDPDPYKMSAILVILRNVTLRYRYRYYNAVLYVDVFKKMRDLNVKPMHILIKFTSLTEPNREKNANSWIWIQKKYHLYPVFRICDIFWLYTSTGTTPYLCQYILRYVLCVLLLG